MRNFLISLTVVIVVLLTFLSASANSTFIPIVYSDGIINPDLQPTAMGVKVDRVTYYTKNYFGYDVRLESVSIKDNSLLVTLHNYDDYNAYGKVYVSLYDEQDNLWNCVTTMYGATIQPNETTALTLPELYPNGYQFIKQYTAYVFAN